jgi:hypothetical protein
MYIFVEPVFYIAAPWTYFDTSNFLLLNPNQQLINFAVGPWFYLFLVGFFTPLVGLRVGWLAFLFFTSNVPRK